MKTGRVKNWTAVIGLALVAGSTLAEEQLAISKNSEAQQDEKVDSDLEQTLKIWSTRVQSSSIYLGETEMTIKQADHLSDLIRTIPGADVGGAHSLNQRITIRSLEDKNLAVTIDGVNQNTYMYHHMGNLQIHSDILQSIEIEVGTNSVIDGGIGGAVRFKTKDAEDLLMNSDEFGGRIQAGYSSNDSQTASFTGYGQLSDDVDGLFYHNQVDRGNYQVGGSKILDNDGNELANTDGTVRGLEGNLQDTLLKLGWDITNEQRLEFGFESYQDKGNYSYRPDMGLATDIAIGDNLGLPLTYATRFTRDTTRLGYELDWGNDNSLSATLFNNESTLWRDESAVVAVFAESASTVEGTATNTGLSLQNHSNNSSENKHQLIYGLDIIRFETEYLSDNVKEGAEQATNTSVYLQDRISFGNIAFTPGIRYDSVDLESAVVDDRFSQVSASLALEYKLNDLLNIKLSSTQLFKAPEIGEVFVGAGSFDSANPNIDPETGVNSELSLAFAKDVEIDSRLSAGATLFKTSIYDHIYDYATPPPEVGGRSWKDNVGDMTIDGFELYLGYEVNSLGLLLTYSEAESELAAFSHYQEFDGARIDRQQGDTFSFNVDYDIEPLDLALHWDVLSVGSLKAGLDLDGATLDNAKDGFVVHNVSAQWMPESVRGFSLTFGVDNLFDKFYASQSSRTGTSFHPRFGALYLQDYEPGRNIKATVAYQF